MNVFRSGLKTPHIIQEAVSEATILSLVSCRLGVAFVSGATRWRCPEGVVLLPVIDLDVPLPFALVWRKDNVPPLLAKLWLMCGCYRKVLSSLAAAVTTDRTSGNREIRPLQAVIAKSRLRIGEEVGSVRCSGCRPKACNPTPRRTGRPSFVGPVLYLRGCFICELILHQSFSPF